MTLGELLKVDISKLNDAEKFAHMSRLYHKAWSYFKRAKEDAKEYRRERQSARKWAKAWKRVAKVNKSKLKSRIIFKKAKLKVDNFA